MIYALTITVVAGVALLALFAGAALVARKVTRGGGIHALRGWRWYPSPFALLVLIPIAGFLVFRAAPLLVALPLVIPFLWRSRWLGRPMMFFWKQRQRRNDDDAGAMDAQFHSFSDN